MTGQEHIFVGGYDPNTFHLKTSLNSTSRFNRESKNFTSNNSKYKKNSREAEIYKQTQMAKQLSTTGFNRKEVTERVKQQLQQPAAKRLIE